MSAPVDILRHHDGVLVVVPSRQAAARAADPLLSSRDELQSAAVWTADIVTLRELVEDAVAAHPEPRPRLDRVGASLLAADVVDRLEPQVRTLFGPGLEGPGAARAIGAAIARIRMADLSAADLAQAATGARRLKALAATLDLWERSLAKGDWWDDADAHRAAIQAVAAGRWPAGPLQRLEVRDVYDVTPLQGKLLLALARRARAVRVHVPFDPLDEESSRFAFPYIHLLESLTDPALDVEIEYPRTRSPERVVFAAGTDRADEIRGLADWVRDLGQAGEPLEGIGIVVAESSRSSEALARELDRRGVPWHARRAAPLVETPRFAAALLPFRLLDQGFRRVDLIAWATSPLTTALDPDLLRPALLTGPAGRARVAQWNRALASARGAAAARLVRALSDLGALGEEPRTPDDFWKGWDAILATVGLDPGEPWDEALADLREGLESVGRWTGPAISWRAHRRQLLNLLGDRRARAGRPGRGVQILTPYDARGLGFRHLAVAGLAQGALIGRDPSLSVFGERERRALGAMFGTELFRLPGEATAEAALLLGAWLRSTDVEARLSWPAREDDGAPLLPSLEYERLRRARGAPLPDAARPGALPAWRRDVTVARVAELQRIEAARAAFLGEPAGIRRGKGGRYDGSFEATVREALAAEGIGLRWTTHRLETFRACPHRFFQQYLLLLGPSEETPLEARPTAVGSVVHRALEILHDEGVGPEPPTRSRIDAALAAAEKETKPAERGDPDVWRALVSRAAAYLDRYFRRILPPLEGDPFRPQKFEAKFGIDPDGAPGAPVETAMGTLILGGRIDRLDRDPVTNRLRIVDYKYSTTQYQRDAVKPDLCGVDRFQLWGYYLGAIEWAKSEGWGEPAAILGEIHCIRDYKKSVLEAPPAPPRAEVEAAVAGVVEAALGGDYDPSPLDPRTCDHCDYRRSCRIATVSLGTVAAPPEDEP